MTSSAFRTAWSSTSSPSATGSSSKPSAARHRIMKNISDLLNPAYGSAGHYRGRAAQSEYFLSDRMHPVPVLLYHRVSTVSGPWTTSREIFRAHLQWLAAHGYRSLSLSELEHVLDDELDAGPRRFVLSFDDSLAELNACMPTVREFGFSAVAFVVTRLLGSESTYLDWDCLASLTASGALEVQSHGHSHAWWSSSRTDIEAVAADLRRSRELISDRLGVPATHIRHLAWPYGRCTLAMEQAGLRCGFRYQYLVQRGAVTRCGSTVRLPRLSCDRLSPASFARWMRVLSSPTGATVANRCFGYIRRYRRGMGYTGTAPWGGEEDATRSSPKRVTNGGRASN